MNLPSRSWNTFEGMLERVGERAGRTVTRIRNPKVSGGGITGENLQVYENVLLTFLDEDQPRRYQGWGSTNLNNANAQSVLFHEVMDVQEGDMLLFDRWYWRVQNVNLAGTMGKEGLGWIVTITREREADDA